MRKKTRGLGLLNRKAPAETARTLTEEELLELARCVIVARALVATKTGVAGRLRGALTRLQVKSPQGL